VVHPQHALNGKIVKVLGREAGHWIIARPDGSPEKLPLAWAEALTPIIPSADNPEPWAGVIELLDLVKIINPLRAQPPEELEQEASFLILSASVCVRRTQPPEEVDDGSQSRDPGASGQVAAERSPDPQSHPEMGSIPAGETARTGASPGWVVASAGSETIGEA
jgi:hypothetical protein